MATDVTEMADAVRESKRSRWIGIYIAVLAVLLSIATMIGKNAEKDAAKANLDATNLWAFFQAKNIRRSQLQLATDDLKLRLAVGANGSPDAAGRAAIEEKIKAYEQDIARYTSDKQRNEGLDELFVRARALEKKRDDQLQREPYFDFGEAFLQIAIVLASVAIVTAGFGSLVLSMIIGGLGLISVANGTFMLATIPGI